MSGEDEASDRIDLMVERARLQLAHGAPQAAVETLREALSEDPEEAHAHALLALALVASKRLHGAEHEVREALRLAPEEPFSHHAAGVVYMSMRRMALAEEHLRRAEALDPDESGIKRGLAQLYGMTGRDDK